MALHSDEEDERENEGAMLYGGGGGGGGGSRNRSGSTLSASMSRMSLASSVVMPTESPRMRRTNTAPTNLSARYMLAKHDFAGGAADELPLSVGQVIEVKSEVNDDWYIGESDGLTGLFPSSYCEEYTPNPLSGAAAGVPPPLPTTKRSLPPLAGGAGAGNGRMLPPPTTTHRSPSPGLGAYDHSESEFDSHGFEDADHYATAALSSAPQANPVSRGASPSPALAALAVPKKKAPPPPPSRRSQSSSNILAAAATASSSPSSSSLLSPPQPAYRRASPGAGASPFGGSEDEAEYLDVDSRSGSSPGPRSMGNGLGAMHLSNNTGGLDVAECDVCGCDDFTQNAFKPQGTCSTCFHQHA